MKKIIIVFAALILLTSVSKVTYEYTKEQSPKYVIIKTFAEMCDHNWHQSERKVSYTSQKYVSEKIKKGWVFKDISTTAPAYGYSKFTITVTLIKY